MDALVLQTLCPTCQVGGFICNVWGRRKRICAVENKAMLLYNSCSWMGGAKRTYQAIVVVKTYPAAFLLRVTFVTRNTRRSAGNISPQSGETARTDQEYSSKTPSTRKTLMWRPGRHLQSLAMPHFQEENVMPLLATEVTNRKANQWALHPGPKSTLRLVSTHPVQHQTQRGYRFQIRDNSLSRAISVTTNTLHGLSRISRTRNTRSSCENKCGPIPRPPSTR